jgi:hypothetical protein
MITFTSSDISASLIILFHKALIGDIVHNIQHTLAVVESDPVTAAKNVQAQLQYLAACCRGLQSPNDDYQSLVARNAAYDMFASGSINTLYETVPGASKLSQTINDTITRLVYLYSKDQETTQVSHVMMSFQLFVCIRVLNLS